MGFKEAIRTCLRKTFTLSGRASLSEFWWFVLFVNLIVAGLVVLSYMTTDGFYDYPGSGGIFAAMIPLVVMLVVLIPLAIAGFTVEVRRFHDLNLSGWWVVWGIVAINIPSFGWLVAVVMIVISTMPGSVGENRHGPDPLGPVGPRPGRR
jgi:uncharacterized membrane protein YhaH (DUF805 family)